MSFRQLFEDNIAKAKTSKEAYDAIDKGIAVIFKLRSDRYTYNNPEDTEYVKDWTPTTKKEKETLSPEGMHRVKEREQAAQDLGINEDNKGAYQEKQISIPSTAINAIKYDPVSESLEVKFNSSKKWYFYPNVPMELIQGLMKAPSKGEYFMEHIHDQYSMYRTNHKPKTKKEQRAVKLYKKAYDKTNKNRWPNGK